MITGESEKEANALVNPVVVRTEVSWRRPRPASPPTSPGSRTSTCRSSCYSRFLAPRVTSFAFGLSSPSLYAELIRLKMSRLAYSPNRVLERTRKAICSQPFLVYKRNVFIYAEVCWSFPLCNDRDLHKREKEKKDTISPFFYDSQNVAWLGPL